jgi:hypothetical protein
MARWRASLIPAKPRRLDVRREREAGLLARARILELDDLVRERGAGDFRVFDRERARDFVARERLADLVELDLCDLVSPLSRRILFTVLAATSSARRPYRPVFLALSLMCSYCRSRFGLAPRGMRLLPYLSIPFHLILVLPGHPLNLIPLLYHGNRSP